MMRVFGKAACALVLICGVAAWSGCTQEEKLYRVSGVVTYDGKPIAKGLIFFDPQAGGPQGFANILEGKYDTKQGKGVRGGAYNIRVNGFDGNKSFVLSTTNALGGKNYFLAVCYLVVGALCLVFAVIFLVAFVKKNKDRRND